MIPVGFYGWRRGLPTRRFPTLALTKYPLLAPKANLQTTGYLPSEVWNQGTTSSCTGHGSTAAIMYARAKQGLPFIDLSRLFPYWNGRAAENGTGTDGGATIADVISASQKFGDCPYADLPTDPALVTTAPSVKAFTDAILHKSLGASRVYGATTASTAYHFKHCIDVLGLPVVVGITVYESFESDEVAKTGVVPMPGPREAVLGGHCILGVAYDDSTQMVLCRNSWGEDWGQKGYFQIPYDYLFDKDMADDFHCITLAA
jgi:hypothetical protein